LNRLSVSANIRNGTRSISKQHQQELQEQKVVVRPISEAETSVDSGVVMTSVVAETSVVEQKTLVVAGALTSEAEAEEQMP
jgi:hypothetical protein